MRLSVRSCRQNALFRTARVAECAFPYGTGCRMRFSVECAFPHLGKRRAASRKSAFCALGLTKKCSLYVGPHEKVHSVLTASRKGAVCPRHSRRMRLSVRSCRQNALFRRVRLFSPGQTSSRLTQKRILCLPPHGKVQSAPSTSRKSAVCARAVAQNAPFREVRPQAEVRDPGATRPAAWRAVARARLPSWAFFHSAPHSGGRLPCAPLRAAT